jgi:hypothetical protein
MRYRRANLFYNVAFLADVSVPGPFCLLLGFGVFRNYICLTARRLEKYSSLFIELNWKHQTLC